MLVWTAVTRGGDAHAGRTETSLMLAIDEGSVRSHLAERGCTEPLQAILPRLRAEGVRPVSSNGVLGNPEGANAAEGRALLDCPPGSAGRAAPQPAWGLRSTGEAAAAAAKGHQRSVA